MDSELLHLADKMHRIEYPWIIQKRNKIVNFFHTRSILFYAFDSSSDLEKPSQGHIFFEE